MKRQGISLIVLVITIIIIVILAGAVILNLADNNPIENAEKAKIMSDLETFSSEFTLSVGKKYADTQGMFDPNTIKDQEIEEYIPSIKGEKIEGVLYTDILTITGGTIRMKENDAISEESKKIIKEVLGQTEYVSDEEKPIIPENPTPEEPTIQTYEVTYNANGGVGSIASQEKEAGTTLKLSTDTPTKEDCIFLGWATSADAAEIEYEAGADYNADESVELYAVWQMKYIKLVGTTGSGAGSSGALYSISENRVTDMLMGRVSFDVEKGSKYTISYTSPSGGMSDCIMALYDINDNVIEEIIFTSTLSSSGPVPVTKELTTTSDTCKILLQNNNSAPASCEIKLTDGTACEVKENYGVTFSYGTTNRIGWRNAPFLLSKSYIENKADDNGIFTIPVKSYWYEVSQESPIISNPKYCLDPDGNGTIYYTGDKITLTGDTTLYVIP